MGGLVLGGEPVTHPRVIAALRAGLDLSDTGEPTVRIGAHWCYLTVEDCPLRATAVVADEHGAPQLRLDDGRTVALSPRTLWEEPGRGLRCTAPARDSGRALPVRFTNAAQMDLLPWLSIDDAGAATVRIGTGHYRLGNDDPGPA